MTMRPFFSFYGSKWRIAPKYPIPMYGVPVIEPFAGSAGYSIRHASRPVHLYDVDEAVVSTWRYLIRSTNADIMRLPLMDDVDSVEDLQVCDEAKILIGWWLNKGTSRPSKTFSAWARRPEYASQFWGERIRSRVARQVEGIKHWSITEASFETIPNRHATWFVDPPYSGADGDHYRYAAVDYAELAQWCRARLGLTIVCENDGADWLPFEPFCVAKSNIATGVSLESVWTQTRYAERLRENDLHYLL